MLRDFKEFIARGNVIDLAVAVVIGAAFGKIVTSLVEGVIMPPIGLALGHVDFSNLFLVLGSGHYPSLKAAQEAGAATLNYGVFINTLINFAIVAFALFAIVKVMNRMKREAPPAPAPTARTCTYCTMEIPQRALRCPHCTSELKAA